jgi:uncharacterized protein DUF3592
MALLPPRPLPLDSRAIARRRLKKRALAALAAGIGVAFSVGTVFFTRELLGERALWDRGAEGRILRLSGKVEESQKLGLTFLYDYELDVRWADVQGRERDGKTSFLRMFKAVSEAPALRYDPAAPDRFVLSWAARGGLPRSGMAIVCGALGAVMLLGTIVMVRSEQQRTEALRVCAEDGEEMLCRVEKAWEYKGAHYVQYRLPDDGRLRTYEGDAPLIITRDGVQHVLALRSPRAPDAPFLVDADLRSFDLSQEERARIGNAVRTRAEVA